MIRLPGFFRIVGTWTAILGVGIVVHSVSAPQPHVVIGLDLSRSVSDTTYTRFVQIVDQITSDGIPWALLTFGDDIHWHKSFDTPDALSLPAHPTAARTRLYDAIMTAIRTLRDRDSVVPGVILFLTDGVDDGSILTLDDIRIALHISNIRFHAIAVGRQPRGYRTLARLAYMSGGRVWTDTDFSVHEWSTVLASLRESRSNAASTASLEPIVPDYQSTQTSAPFSKNVPPDSRNRSARPSAYRSTRAAHQETMSPEPALPDQESPMAPSILHFTGWLLWGLGSVIVLALVALLFVFWRRRRRRYRICPDCGHALEPLAIACPQCQRPTTADTAEVEAVQYASMETYISEEAIEALQRTMVLPHVPALIVQRGKLAGTVFTLPMEGKVILGRAPDCDIVLNDPTVSAYHCQLKFENGQWRIQDLRSTNGTYVNGRRVTEALLRPNDVIRTGMHEMVFRLKSDDRSVAQAEESI